MAQRTDLHFVFVPVLAALLTLLATACGTPAPPDVYPYSGTFEVSLEERAGGRQRSYRMHVPVGLEDPTPKPLVVALHGAFSSAETMQKRSGLDAAAARHRFVVAYPNGEGAMGFVRHWNAGHCCGKAMDEAWDDVGFVRRVIADLKLRLPIAEDRVYVTGFSNGGMLAWRFAAAHPELVAAVAPIAATLADARELADEAGPLEGLERWTPAIVVHGAADLRIPPEDVKRSLAFWAAGSGCAPEPEERLIREGLVRMRSWPGCDPGSSVVAYELADWAHRWPGPYLTDEREDALRGFDTAEILWRFFDAQFPSR